MIAQRRHDFSKLALIDGAGQVRRHDILLPLDDEERVQAARLPLPATVGDQRDDKACRQAVEQIGLAIDNQSGRIAKTSHIELGQRACSLEKAVLGEGKPILLDIVVPPSKRVPVFLEPGFTPRGLYRFLQSFRRGLGNIDAKLAGFGDQLGIKRDVGRHGLFATARSLDADMVHAHRLCASIAGIGKEQLRQIGWRIIQTCRTYFPVPVFARSVLRLIRLQGRHVMYRAFQPVIPVTAS